MKTWLHPAGESPPTPHRLTDMWALHAATRSLRRYLSPFPLAGLIPRPCAAALSHTHSARSPLPCGDPREAGSHGRRGGRRRRDGRRPEAAHVRGRVSALPSPSISSRFPPLPPFPLCVCLRAGVSRRASGFGGLLLPPRFCVLVARLSAPPDLAAIGTRGRFGFMPVIGCTREVGNTTFGGVSRA